jgi:hypothetical protein
LTPISTNVATNGTVTFRDTSATGDMNFYGVRRSLNP